MKKLWLRWSARYAARSGSERILIAILLVAGIPLLEHRLLKDAGIAQRERNARLAAEKRSALAEMQAKTVALEAARQVDPHAEARARLEALRLRSSELEANIWAAERSMVTAVQMPELLKNLLRQQSGLRLIDLRTLPATPLVTAPATAATGADGKAAVPALPVSARERNLFKHGVELRLEGTYTDLLAYLTALEKAPQRMVWDSLSIAAESYPRVVLTLTIYTVNLEQTWLVV